MRNRKSDRLTYECVYCGTQRDNFNDDEVCNCGGEWVLVKDDNGFYWGDQNNNIDNILESKRGGRH